MAPKPRISALIVAAGAGMRAGGAVPKQYAPVQGRPMLCHSVAALRAHAAIGAVRVVIDPSHRAHYDAAIGPFGLPEPVAGGATRADSVRAGLAALAADAPDYVLVHDAARPHVPTSVLDRLFAALAPDTGVIPALPMADTVRRFSRQQWEEVNRDGLLRVQTPQLFPYRALVEAMQHVASPTDEAAAWLAANHKLAYVEGAACLQKVTSAAELEGAMMQPARIAVGMGYDVHALMPAGAQHRIRLGGLDIPHNHKLHGHSDADVVLHAIVDAVLGALAEGDIGMHFPPSDPQWKGAESTRFVEAARERVAARGGSIEHADITIICEHPKIGPHRDAMRTCIATLLGVGESRVSVKATTTEKLGFTGREEGIAAQAVVTLKLPESV